METNGRKGEIKSWLSVSQRNKRPKMGEAGASPPQKWVIRWDEGGLGTIITLADEWRRIARNTNFKLSLITLELERIAKLHKKSSPKLLGIVNRAPDRAVRGTEWAAIAG
jgi:hypothetical protein